MKLPDNTKIQSFTLRVKNLDEMRRFYEHMLGLTVTDKKDNEAYLFTFSNIPFNDAK